MLYADGLTPGLTFFERWEIRLGSLAFSWDTGPHTVDESGKLYVPVDIPQEAFLHELAEDYLTDMRVRLDATLGGGPIQRLLSPSLFLAWPDGAYGGARVWNEETAQQEPPLGIIDEDLRARYAGSHATRILAPLPKESRLEPDAVELRERQE